MSATGSWSFSLESRATLHELGLRPGFKGALCSTASPNALGVMASRARSPARTIWLRVRTTPGRRPRSRPSRRTPASTRAVAGEFPASKRAARRLFGQHGVIEGAPIELVLQAAECTRVSVPGVLADRSDGQSPLPRGVPFECGSHRGSGPPIGCNNGKSGGAISVPGRLPLSGRLAHQASKVPTVTAQNRTPDVVSRTPHGDEVPVGTPSA